MINKHDYSRQLLKLLCGILLLAVAACGSAPARQPVATELAKKADHEAHRAMRDGDLKRARELFRQTMLMQQSLDDLPGSAMAAINLSSVSHKLGDSAAALGLLNEVLAADNQVQIPSDLRIATSFRKAVILADTGKDADAQSALLMAIQECGKQCAFSAGINNLSARIALKRDDFTLALTIANSVISAGAEKEELANALRIAGAAEFALEQYASGLAHYQSALELDKELALSSRIAEDLQGIAKSLAKQGRKIEADVFARRAEAVNAAARTLSANAAAVKQ